MLSLGHCLSSLDSVNIIPARVDLDLLLVFPPGALTVFVTAAVSLSPLPGSIAHLAQDTEPVTPRSPTHLLVVYFPPLVSQSLPTHTARSHQSSHPPLALSRLNCPCLVLPNTLLWYC